MKLRRILLVLYGSALFLSFISGFLPYAYGDEIKGRFISKKDAISITSNRMVLHQKEHLIVFKGNVVVKGRSITLKADEVEVKFKGEGQRRKISTITATGHVRLYQGDRMVQSDRVVYDRQTAQMVFTGSPYITEGEDRIYGKRIIVYVNKDKVVVEGGEAFIHPR